MYEVMGFGTHDINPYFSTASLPASPPMDSAAKLTLLTNILSASGSFGGM